MHVLYFVQYFNLPDEPGGSRPYQFARTWVEAGHRVTVVTGMVNHKTLTVPERYRGRLVVAEQVDGIRLLRTWSYAGIRGSFKKRLLNFLSYAATATLVGLVRAGRPDLVYASSTPLTVGIPGWFLSLLRGAPFFFEVRDLWPQSAVVAGVLGERSLVTRVARFAARRFYRRASRVVAVTRGIGDGLREEGVPEEKVLFVPNGVDDWMLEAGDGPAPGPREGFEVVYVGAHGKWNGLGQVLDAAKLIGPDAGIRFSFYGDGDEKAALEERARAEGLAHVTFHGALPKKEAFQRIRRGSASIVVTWKHPFQRMVLANKIFDYLAAGRPVIVGAEGEMADLVREAGCGVVVPPEDPPALAAAIREMAAKDPEELARMGRAGRRYILERYQRRDLALRLLDEMIAVAGDGATPAAGPRLVGEGER